MAFILVIGGLIALCALALRYGHDSRDQVRSEEQTLAGFGFAWHGAPRDVREPALLAPAERTRSVRHRVAGVLNNVADWLYPVPDAQTGERVSA